MFQDHDKGTFELHKNVHRTHPNLAHHAYGVPAIDKNGGIFFCPDRHYFWAFLYGHYPNEPHVFRPVMI